jgi:hypothetical protein
MRSLVFGNVDPDGFLGFADELDKGEWATIDVTSYLAPDGKLLKPLCDAPACVEWKLSLKGAVAAVFDAREGAGSAKELDRLWDGKQKQLAALIQAATNDSDAKKREAAARLHKSLLRGAGTAQTKLRYQQEVDFAKQQALTATSAEVAADVGLLGLGPILDEIAAATAKLAAAIGHGEGSDRPSDRFRGAVAECAAEFASVANRITSATKHGMEGEDRQRAQRLLAPLEALVARYPAPAPAAPATPAAPAAPAAPATPPAAAGGTPAPAPAGGAQKP